MLPLRPTRRAAFSLLVLAALAPLAGNRTPAVRGAARIAPNDNRVAAGATRGGVREVEITARTGEWFPDGSRRPAALTVAAFAEGNGTPSIPGPLIRVRAGTRVRITIRNALDGNFAGRPIAVHGLHAHPAKAGDSTTRLIHVDAGATRTVEFEAGAPGTYFYWAAFSDSTRIPRRRNLDAALNGAIVVDPADGPIVADRIFVMTRMVLPPEGEGESRQPGRFSTSINGLSWPLTERLEAAVGDTLHWRWINATSNAHPMHLHGFYYNVDALGDERADTALTGDDRKLVVTERMNAGATMSMTWIPERAGHWLMHCHLQVHTGPNDGWGFPDIPGTPAFGRGTQPTPAEPAHAHDMSRDMAGLIVGITVHEARSGVTLAGASTSTAARHDVRLTLVGRAPADDGERKVITRVDDDAALGGTAHATGIGVGPAIVLRRGEPARVIVRNTSSEPTALHWHGIELESYFDGVPGFTGGAGGGGAGGRTSPEVEPGGQFDALMTPPRAGTFIYHAHMLTTTQLADGLYGPLIVLDRGEAYEPAREVTWIVGGPLIEDSTSHMTLNGSRAPAALTLVAGRRYRVRVINIAETNAVELVLFDGEGSDATPLSWRALAKDAIPLPASRATERPAKVFANVGETFDFELTPAKAGSLRVDVKAGLVPVASQRVVVVPP